MISSSAFVKGRTSISFLTTTALAFHQVAYELLFCHKVAHEDVVYYYHDWQIY